MAFARRGAEGAEAVKLAMLERFSRQMLATARRYSDTLDDAEDAYQRAAEILLTRGPALDRGGHVPLASHNGQARGDRHPPPARAHGPARRPGAGARAARRAARHPRARRALRAPAPRRPGAGAAEAAGGALPGAQGGGLHLQGDLRADRVLVHEGGSLPQGGPKRVRRTARGYRVRGRVQPDRSRALRPRRRRGRRGGHRRDPTAPAQLSSLPRPAARVPGGAITRRRAGAPGRPGRRHAGGRRAAAHPGRVADRRAAGPRGRARRPRPPGRRAGHRPEGGRGGVRRGDRRRRRGGRGREAERASSGGGLARRGGRARAQGSGEGGRTCHGRAGAPDGGAHACRSAGSGARGGACAASEPEERVRPRCRPPRRAASSHRAAEAATARAAASSGPNRPSPARRTRARRPPAPSRPRRARPPPRP